MSYPGARAILRVILAAFYLGAGVLHLTAPDPFLLIAPAWVPFPREVILLTGACEIAGALGLLLPRFRKAAGVGLALYAVCVFPANVKHAFENIAVPGLPQSWWYHGPRLAFQPVLVWLTLFAAELATWPLRERAAGDARLTIARKRSTGAGP